MGLKFAKAKEKWENVRHSSRFHNFLLFLLFTAVATLFWLVMVMNENVQKNIDVTLTITEKPDSITFISLPPKILHVTVRDKGTKIFRAAVFKTLQIDLNFREFAENGIFRLSTSDLYAALRTKLGNEAQISALSCDSLHLPYTSLPGKKVLVEAEAQLSAANGFVVDTKLLYSKKFVTVYSTKSAVLDTIQNIKTRKIIKTNLSKTTKLKVALQQPEFTRVEPSVILITIPVEPLVLKEIHKEIKVIDVPNNENVLLFPATAMVSAYVPMSKFNYDINLNLEVNYDQVHRNKRKLPISINNMSEYAVNPTVKPDSVEFTLVR